MSLLWFPWKPGMAPCPDCAFRGFSAFMPVTPLVSVTRGRLVSLELECLLFAVGLYPKCLKMEAVPFEVLPV